MTVSRAEGATIWDADGREYLDFAGGIACQNLGSMWLRKALAAKNATDRQSGLQQAETYTRRAIELDPALPDAQTTMGVILASSGRKTEAIDSWKRAVALDGTQFNALYNLWSELSTAGRHDEAVTYGRQFVATAPPAFFKPDIDRVRQFLGPERAR
jgi:tetratricopeptide (TPR) repeat protein